MSIKSNRRKFLKLFSFVIPALVLVPERILEQTQDNGEFEIEEWTPDPQPYDGPPIIIGFQAHGIGNIRKPGVAGIRRQTSEIFRYSLNEVGGLIHWCAGPRDAIVSLDEYSPIGVFVSSPMIVAAAVRRLPGVARYQIINN